MNKIFGANPKAYDLEVMYGFTNTEAEFIVRFYKLIPVYYRDGYTFIKTKNLYDYISKDFEYGDDEWMLEYNNPKELSIRAAYSASKKEEDSELTLYFKFILMAEYRMEFDSINDIVDAFREQLHEYMKESCIENCEYPLSKRAWDKELNMIDEFAINFYVRYQNEYSCNSPEKLNVFYKQCLIMLYRLDMSMITDGLDINRRINVLRNAYSTHLT